MPRSLHLALALCLLGGVGLAACQSVKVQSDYDDTVDFARYQTFAWLPQPDSVQRDPQINEVLDNRIRQTIERELEADGYQRSIAGRPDVYVVYHTAFERKLGPAYLATWGYGLHGKPAGVRMETYQEGTLIIDLVDAERNALVWRGTATGAIKNLALAEKKLFEAVERIFAAFPPASS